MDEELIIVLICNCGEKYEKAISDLYLEGKPRCPKCNRLMFVDRVFKSSEY